jgi:prophage DNA circulation protein
MSHITDSPSSWRRHWVQAQFRDAIFYVETDARGSGRRVALHQYPKRNIPYAEDMGRSAITIQVNGYCIGRQTLTRERGVTSIAGVSRSIGGRTTPTGNEPRNLTTARATDANRLAAGRDYLTMKNALITALEKDGPGLLRLPMQFITPKGGQDIEVMAMGYTVTESRESGGMCRFQMQFVEYGDPRYRSTINTAEAIRQKAASVETVLMAAIEGKTRDQIIEMFQPYTNVFNNASSAAGDDRGLAGLLPSVPTTGGGFTTGGSF